LAEAVFPVIGDRMVDQLTPAAEEILRDCASP